MKKFVALFCIPAAAIKEWMEKVDEATRKKQTDEMMESWKKWMADHKDSIVDEGHPIGKTKRVTKDGIADARNELNYAMIIQAESHEAAAQLVKDSPHLQIPTAYIDVSDATPHEM